MAQSNSSHRPSVLGGTISSLVVASLFVAARIFTRLKIVKRFGWDDGWIILAWVLSFGLSFSICYGTSKGIGLHFTNIPQEWVSPLGGTIYAFTVLYYPAILVTKISILTLYLRIFRSHKLTRRGSIILIVVDTFAYVGLTCAKAFRCQPISAAWQLAPRRPVKCIDIVIIHLASTPVNVYTNLAIMLLPIPVLSSLRLPRRQKIILIFTFVLGAFDVIISIIRIIFLEQALLKNALKNRLYGSGTPLSGLDITYGESLAFMWSAVEVNIAIVCACIITLKPLVMKVFPTILEGSRRKHGSGGSSTRPESSRAEEKSASSFRPNRNIRAPYSNSSHLDPFVSSSTAHSADVERVGPGADRLAPGGNANAEEEAQGHAARLERDLSALVGRPASVVHADVGAGHCREANYYGMEFITTPDMNNVSSHHGAALIPQNPETHRRGCISVHLPSKCINNLSTKESYLPFAIITILFFLLQFLFTLMNVHVTNILGVLNLSSLRRVQIQATYFTGYFIGPLFISRFTLARFSLHVTLLAGLLTFSAAPMFFWPAAVLLSLPALIVSYFVLGLGFSVVYNGIVVFVSLCGPVRYAVLRFLFLQGVGNIGKLLSFILATKYIFPERLTETTILNAQWTFLGVTFLVVFFAVLLYYIPLPGVSYDYLARDAEYTAGVRQMLMSPWKKAYVCNWDVMYTTLALGVFSAFCYSGFNSITAYLFTDYVHSMDPTSALSEQYITWIAAAARIIGQFVAASICYYVRPSWVLLSCCLINIVLSTLTITVEGTAGVVVIVVLEMWAGPVFPLLFSISLSRLGLYTFAASTYLTATLSAGALFIPVTYFVQKHPSVNPIQYSFCVALACSCFGITMPLFINVSRAARKQVNRRGEG